VFYRFYSFLLFVALILYAPLYWFKVRFLKKDRLNLGQRLGRGLPKRTSSRPCVWIHAVSVGEVLSLQHLIGEAKRKHPDWEIAFSSLTGSGLRQAREKLKGADPIFFVPLDFGGPVRRVLDSLRPDLLVLAESELWPNLLKEARLRTLGILLINGRISERTYRRYLKIKGPARRVLGLVDRFLVQTPLDRDRIVGIGVDPDRVEVAGNLKTEVHLPDVDARDLAALKAEIGLASDRKVFLAGSTRKGEEERLLRSYAAARPGVPGTALIVAPRHPERAGDVERLAASFSLVCVRRTRGVPAAGWDVLILDTIGELARFYALCDVAFVGGSLVDWGGHNFLEPAFYGKPIFFGRHMKNFAVLADTFLSKGAARAVESNEELIRMFRFEDEESLRAMGRKAAALLASLSGATERTLEAIEDALEGKER
jgi:3-deoxy-D-manno-octulosonic-acid transferase